MATDPKSMMQSNYVTYLGWCVDEQGLEFAGISTTDSSMAYWEGSQNELHGPPATPSCPAYH